jgi:hypothetical protein
MQPLQKKKVYELTHPRDAYGEKWAKMKKKRDERIERTKKRMWRQDIITAVNKTVIASDKMVLNSALEQLVKEDVILQSQKYEQVWVILDVL